MLFKNEMHEPTSELLTGYCVVTQKVHRLGHVCPDCTNAYVITDCYTTDITDFFFRLLSLE
jgi:hypothetical protein